MKKHLRLIALVICLTLIFAGCAAQMPAQVAPAPATPSTAATPVIDPTAPPASLEPTNEIVETTAPATPMPDDETTYLALEETVGEMILSQSKLLSGSDTDAAASSASAKFVRKNEDKTLLYSFLLEESGVKSEGVATVKLKSSPELGVSIESVTVDGCATQTPVAAFVESMKDVLGEYNIEYELLGPGGSTFSGAVGNPTFANLDYFWLDAATRPHSDVGEVESISVKFNDSIDDRGKAILLTSLKTLSHFVTMEALDAQLDALNADGQALVGSVILEYSGGEYRMNLPDEPLE